MQSICFSVSPPLCLFTLRIGIGAALFIIIPCLSELFFYAHITMFAICSTWQSYYFVVHYFSCVIRYGALSMYLIETYGMHECWESEWVKFEWMNEWVDARQGESVGKKLSVCGRVREEETKMWPTSDKMRMIVYIYSWFLFTPTHTLKASIRSWTKSRASERRAQKKTYGTEMCVCIKY